MENHIVQKEVVDFLYNGCVAFFPEIFFPEEKKQPVIFYSGLNREKFEKLIKEITLAQDLVSAVETIRSWKTKSDKGEAVKSTVPINIEELVEFSEVEIEKIEKARKQGKIKTEEFIKQASKQRATKETKQEQGAEATNINNTKLEKEEIELTSPIPPVTIRLSKEQQKIIGYAHNNPQKFADELTGRITKTSGLNPQNPIEIESAKMVAKIFAIKLADINPSAKEITIDSSPFEVLSIFSDSQNETFKSLIHDEKTRENIARTTQELARIIESDTTLAANLIDKATGVDFSFLFIPPQIRELKEISEEQKGKTPGINVNIKNFLEQIASAQTLQRQIRKAVIDDKTYNNLTTAEKIKIDEEIKRASSKISSVSRAFSFLTSKPPFVENANFEKIKSGWLDLHFSAIGITTESFPFISIHLGFQSPNVLQSPVFNLAFDKFIQKLPASAKLKSVVSGLTTKLSQKTAAKIAATKIGAKVTTAVASNAIPIIGQAVSLISSLSLAKDLAIWIKKNSDKIPYVVAGIFVGGFAVTGAPLFLIGGVSIVVFTSRASIGNFVLSAFSAIGTAIIASLVIPMLIIFVGIPFLVAIIIFIINSGAYVYPPSTSNSQNSPGTVIQSEYISLTKKADVSKISNLTSIQEVNYTIQITPKKGSVTIKKIENKYNIAGGINPNSIQSPDLSSHIGKIIDSSQSLTINYKITLNPSHNNSIIEDIVTVVVATSDGKDSTASAAYSIIIGSPPIDCPIPNGTITWWSYQPGDENSKRHGNNRYWGSYSCKSWPLPQTTKCYGPSDPAASNNKCHNESSTCDYYGYAIDVVGNNSVYAPSIGGQQLTWMCSYYFANGGGSAGYTYICSSGQYRLILTHMKNGARTGKINSGEQIGELYPMNNAHLHIELAINGQYVKPENYLCR